MKKAHIDGTNQLLGWYDDDLHSVIPLPHIEVTEEQWQEAIDKHHNKVNHDGTTEVFDFRTPEELAQEIEDAKPKSITMRQARLALLEAGLLETVTEAIQSGTDEAMKIEWEYAAEIEREWQSLITLATALGLSSDDLDALFLAASEL